MAAPVSSVFEREGKVVLDLHGQYTAAQAREGVAEAARLFKALDPCEFVVDMRDLAGYDTGARQAWQENLAEFRRRIHTVTMVGGSALVRMTGSAVCLAAGIKMRLVDHIDEAFRGRSSIR